MKVSGHQCTEAFPCQKGVRQGCTLSPSLFSLYISQLQSVLCGNNGGVDSVINTLMFADDIVLLSTSGDGSRITLSYWWKGTALER